MHKFVNRFYWKNSKATSRPVSIKIFLKGGSQISQTNNTNKNILMDDAVLISCLHI